MQVGDITKQDASVQLPVPFIGSFNRDASLAIGTQAVTGVGFKPSYVFVQANINNDAAMSFGFSDAVSDKAKSDNNNEAASDYQDISTQCIHLRTGSSIALRGTIQSFDADGFTVDWTKQGAPTGTVVLNFIAFK